MPQIVLVPVLLAALFFLNTLIFGGLKKPAGLREHILLTYVGFILLMYAETELLSAFNAFHETGIWATNLAVLAVVTFLLWRFRKSIHLPHLEKPDMPTFLPWIGVGFILACTGFIAVYFPPNNWDSMTYNLARVAHWVQHQNVALYPSHIDRQLYNPPLHEYVMAVLYMLAKGDRFVNLVQWSSFLNCILVASLLAKRFGFPKPIQGLTGLVCATTPMLILQSTNTKNELTLAFFVAASAFYWLDYLKNRDWFSLILTGLCIACALATKGTALIFIFPVLVLTSLPSLKQGFLPIVRSGLVVGFIAGLVLLPVFLRNFHAYGHMLGGTDDTRNYYKNEEMGPGIFASNLVRNIGIHLASGNTLGGKAPAKT